MVDDEQLVERADAFVDEVWEDVVRDIDYLVQVESVEDREHAEEGMPFGPAPAEALRRGLEIAERLGLATHNCEGYLGFGDLPGESEIQLAMIAHSDIVPLGRGWHFDPLRATRKDGYLVGRGVIDDKGPLVLSLYAAHFFARMVADSGKRLPYTLRCLIGANEETQMEDVDYYLAHYEAPAFCFTPDAEFPLICGEKGRFFAAIASPSVPLGESRIVSFEGGTVPNAVPGDAKAVVRASCSDLPAAEGIAVCDAGSDEDGRALARIVAHGKGGHASMPEGTTNAIGVLVRYLLDNDLCCPAEKDFLLFQRTLLADAAGLALGIAATDDAFGSLTCVGGTVSTLEEAGSRRFVQTMDVRYPKSAKGGHILETVAAVAREHGCSVQDSSDSVPFFISPDSPEIRTLVRTYNEVSGHDGKAFTIGGGTYARHFPRAAAFGPYDPSEAVPDWVGPEHGPDEGVSEAMLRQALKIYVVAIGRLMRLAL